MHWLCAFLSTTGIVKEVSGSHVSVVISGISDCYVCVHVYVCVSVL